MGFFAPLLHFLFHIGYFGPFVMGVMDSSFLILPFGNDLVVVGLAAQHPRGIPWYIISAAIGSSAGALILALVSRKVGEEGVRRIAGDKRYEKLKKRVGQRSAVAVLLAGLAPPPFPFTTVIAAVGALDYPIWRILLVNFVSRGIRFTLLSLLALKFGTAVLGIAKSPEFRWGMIVFIAICVVASAYSIWRWTRNKPRTAQ
ncbi:MAG TPA: VTT domain-containing protein [Terracidiphilus sp.]|jgi:membrane protein YqaA with SNARE-associated domain|nr:VTT domain-containing protein [Terracidiphilus sp.]